MPARGYRDAFKSTAPYYLRFRPGYPQIVFDCLVRRLDLDGSGRLLDVGCGTGQLALPLAAHFEEVVGMDPEPEMIVEARGEASRLGVRNARWVEGGSFDLENLARDLGMFRLATMGQSFHWMDRDATLRTLDGLVEPGGAIALVGGGESAWTPPDTQRRVDEVIRRWLGETRRAGSGVYDVPKERHESVLFRSPFPGLEFRAFPHHREWTAESILGSLYATSFCSVYVLGEKREGFEQDLRRTLLAFQPTDRFVEEATVELLLAFRR